MKFPQKTSWVICLLNECEAKGDGKGTKIRTLVKQVLDETAKRQMQVELILVNNASTDNTKEVLEGIRQSCPENITVLDEPVQGKAKAERKAFSYLSKKSDTSAVVTMDADGEHDIRDMIKLCQKFYERKPLFVCGSRFSGKRNKKDEILRNVLINFSEVEESKVPDDPRCGARVYNPEFLFRTCSKTAAENYGLELELVGLALKEIKTNPRVTVHSESLDYYVPLRSKVFKKKKDHEEINPELQDICRVLSNVFGKKSGDIREGEQMILKFGEKIGRKNLFFELSELFYKGKMVTDEGQKEPQEFMEVPPSSKK
jgi:glycosyltransferase involved in cell wall biosynthesis